MVTFVCVSVWKPGHVQVWGSSGGEQKLDAGVGGGRMEGTFGKSLQIYFLLLGSTVCRSYVTKMSD